MLSYRWYARMSYTDGLKFFVFRTLIPVVDSYYADGNYFMLCVSGLTRECSDFFQTCGSYWGTSKSSGLAVVFRSLMTFFSLGSANFFSLARCYYSTDRF